MSEDRTKLQPRFGTGNILMGVGIVLIGLAGLIIAAQWQATHSTISLESLPTLKNGFALISEKEAESQYRNAKYHYYLLDKDSGRIWAKNENKDVWEEVYVEGITPSHSPASSRRF